MLMDLGEDKMFYLSGTEKLILSLLLLRFSSFPFLSLSFVP